MSSSVVDNLTDVRRERAITLAWRAVRRAFESGDKDAARRHQAAAIALQRNRSASQIDRMERARGLRAA